jgi:hypothetical protein
MRAVRLDPTTRSLAVRRRRWTCLEPPHGNKHLQLGAVFGLADHQIQQPVRHVHHLPNLLPVSKPPHRRILTPPPPPRPAPHHAAPIPSHRSFRSPVSRPRAGPPPSAPRPTRASAPALGALRADRGGGHGLLRFPRKLKRCAPIRPPSHRLAP